MTIRTYAPCTVVKNAHPQLMRHSVRNSAGDLLASADTEAEALEAKRAFENVLAPRFTRDEAIAIVKKAIVAHHAQGPDGWPEIAATARVVLEALATAGVFSDCGPEQCFSSESCARSMADKLDAAGIK
jgi:hypothetical protein